MNNTGRILPGNQQHGFQKPGFSIWSPSHHIHSFFIVKALLIAAILVPVTSALKAEPARFTNPIAEGADPWVTLHDGKYIWCFSEGNRGVSVWVSESLNSLGNRHVVWRSPKTGPWSREIWAPEMHLLDGKWYIYLAASDGRNENHLAYVLESSSGDPLGSYQIHGPFATGDGPDGKSPNVWAIDMTVMAHGGKRYAIWSGWDKPGSDKQFLYIAPMKNPRELAAPRVRIASNDDHLWERLEEREGTRGLNEGPQILKRAGRTFVTYSCGASWLRTYKLGLLELTGNDPLDPASWKKHPEPVFKSGNGVIGVGHSTFVSSPDGSEIWHVYHAKMDDRPGWRRAISIMPFTFKPDGFPDFGSPVPYGKALAHPAGQLLREAKLPIDLSLRDSAELARFSYFGNQQFLSQEKDGVDLGRVPVHPVNDYRSGEKLVLNGGNFADLEVSVKLRHIKGARDAGLLFRSSLPAVGFNAQRGYFAGVIPEHNRVILGKTDGNSWKEIARANAPQVPPGEVTLAVRAVGNRLTVSMNGKQVIEADDITYARGSVGLRVVDTHVRFSDFKVRPAR